MNTVISVQRFFASLIVVFGLAIQLPAQEPAPAKPEDPLSKSQKQLAEQLEKLEALLLRSADIESVDNPTRAALLQQAAQLSKQTQLSSLLTKASQNLNSNQFSEAIEQQKASREALKRLLELLQSENREKRVREQRDQVRRWIEDADRLLRMQSSLRGRTEGGQDTQKAAEDQAKLTDKAQQISQDLQGENATDKDKSQVGKDKKSENSDSKEDPKSQSPKADGQSGENKSGENKSDQNKIGEEKSDGDKSDGNKTEDKKNADGKSEDPKSSGMKSKDDPKSDKKSEDKSDGKSEGKSEDKANDADKNSPEKGESSDSKSGEKSQQSQQQDQPQKGQPQQVKPQQGKPQQGQPQQGQQQQGQPEQDQSEQQPPETQQQQPKSPAERAQEQIQEAQKRMKEAEKDLKDAKREGAVEKQREAEENLKQAIQQLEEILKQLREEEVKRSLETLSTRLRRMLEMQTKIYDESKRLHEIAGEQPDRQILARASSLARDQQKVAAEGERALLLLKEEGSSAAFPEALVQVNRDSASVANRLDSGDVGKVTLVIQADIVQALEEMVEALAKIKKENEEKKQQRQQQQQQGGGQQDPSQQPLINKLAELRLIRTLQVRVNKRTSTLSQMLDNPTDPIGQAKAKDLMEQLQDLGKRQDNIETVTRKVATEEK